VIKLKWHLLVFNNNPIKSLEKGAAGSHYDAATCTTPNSQSLRRPLSLSIYLSPSICSIYVPLPLLYFYIQGRSHATLEPPTTFKLRYANSLEVRFSLFKLKPASRTDFSYERTDVHHSRQHLRSNISSPDILVHWCFHLNAPFPQVLTSLFFWLLSIDTSKYMVLVDNPARSCEILK
jgi:hypothetical protein